MKKIYPRWFLMAAAVCCGVWLAGGNLATAATITVTAANGGLVADRNCTLLEAMAAANSDAPVDLCPAGSGSDTIVFAAGLGTVRMPGHATVLSDVIVEGGAARVTLSGDSNGDGVADARLFHLAGGSLALNNLQMVDALAHESTLVVDPGTGVPLDLGQITFTPTAVGTDVLAVNLTVIDSLASQSTYEVFDGGAVYVSGGAGLTVNQSKLAFNTAPGSGGAIYVQDDVPAFVHINDTTFHANHADFYGGGLRAGFGTSAVLTNTTLAGNSAADGGALYNTGGLTLHHVTAAENSSSEGGAGNLFNAGRLEMFNTLLAYAGNGVDCKNTAEAATVSGNLIADGSCIDTALSGDPLLAPLNYYGGPVPTMALLLGSPAFDSADPALCLNNDARGIARPQLLGCDIGAFESQGFALELLGGDGQAAYIANPFANPLALQVVPVDPEVPLSDARIDFFAPEAGASLSLPIFSAPLDPATGTVVSTDLSANLQAGGYVVKASARGAANALDFNLANLLPPVNLALSTASATEAGRTLITLTASTPVPVVGDQSVAVNVSGSGISADDYNLDGARILIANGSTLGTLSFTVIDDALVEATETALFTISDPTPGIVLGALSSQSATIISDDRAGVVVNPSALNIAENGAGGSYTLSLTAQPQADVTVNLTPANGQIDLGGTLSVTFTPLTWNQPQLVMITAVNDDVAEDLHQSTVYHSVTSADPHFAGVPVANFDIAIWDDDLASLSIIENDGVQVSEAGLSDTYSIVLGDAPRADVTVSVGNNDGQLRVTPAALVFTPNNWSLPQVVTVRAVDDTLVEGNHSSSITHRVSSTDPAYAALSLHAVAVSIIDNDAAATPIQDVVVLHNDIIVDSEGIDFGSADVGAVLADSLKIYNAGSQTLLFSEVMWPAGYSSRGEFPAGLPPGAEATLVVEVDTRQPGELSGFLTFTATPADGGEVIPVSTPFTAYVIARRTLEPDTSGAVTLALSGAVVGEHQAPGTYVGTLSASGDAMPTAYLLPSDITDNQAFRIVDGELRTARPLDYREQNNYTIQVVAVFEGNRGVEQTFMVVVTPHPGLTLSNNRISENRPTGTWIGNLSDPLAADAYFSFSGDTPDNRYFALTGNQLLSAAIFDFEQRRNYSIGIVSVTADGARNTQYFTIFVDAESVGFERIDLGWRHACGLTPAHTMLCWGWSNFGQIAVPGGLKARQISLGDNHSCALGESGRVRCWGSNDNGQILAPGGDNFLKIEGGGSHGCALDGEHRVTCWGYNYDGQAAAPEGLFTDISAGGFHTCGVRADSTLECWGWNNFGQSAPPAGAYTGLTSGEYHSCALSLETRQAVCWGKDTRAQTQVPPGLQAVQVSAGSDHSCALRPDNGITCWGNDDYQQSTAPVDLDFKQVVAGDRISCALYRNGSEHCWGLEAEGQGRPPAAPPNRRPLSLDFAPQSGLPAQIDAEMVLGTFSTVDLEAGDTHTYSLVDGAADNARFRIEADSLISATALPAGTYSVRVKTDDGHHGVLYENFVITVGG